VGNPVFSERRIQLKNKKIKNNFNPNKQIFKNWPGIVFLKYSIIEHIKKSKFMVHIILFFADIFSYSKSIKNVECFKVMVLICLP